MGEPLPAKYDFTVRRGDTRVWQHQFFQSPPQWAPATSYVAGVIDSATYLANSTVTHLGLTYTCITAHTSTASFLAADWTADPRAVGAPIDITDWTFLAQYRLKDDDPLAEPTAVDAITATDEPHGVIVRTLAHTEAAKLVPGQMVWDLQATEADGTTVRTFLYSEKIKVQGDVSR